MIDFDLAGPGPRLKDIAYALYWMVPLSFYSNDQVAFAEADVRNGSRRCRLFCGTYGVTIDLALFDMVDEVLSLMGNEQQMQSIIGVTATTSLKAAGHLSHWQRERVAFQHNRGRIEDNLLASPPV